MSKLHERGSGENGMFLTSVEDLDNDLVDRVILSEQDLTIHQLYS